MSGSQFSFPLYTGSGVKLTSSGLQDEPSLTHVLIHFSSFNASSFCLMRRLKDSKTLTKTDSPSDVKLPLTNSDINICLRDSGAWSLESPEACNIYCRKVAISKIKVLDVV